MTGPEHYREAERLIEWAHHDDSPDPALTLATAQIHATLAVAAATAGQLADRYVGDGKHINEWAYAAGVLRHQDGAK